MVFVAFQPLVSVVLHGIACTLVHSPGFVVDVVVSVAAIPPPPSLLLKERDDVQGRIVSN